VLGPADGRYLVRGHAGEPSHAVVLRTLGAPQRRLLGARRPRAAPPEPPPEPVATARATLIAARPFEGEGAAELWLREAEAEAAAAALRPQERLAALLAGRDVALACEALALRARADLDAGRTREAALQLRVALAAALDELLPWAPRGDLEQRIAELQELRPAADAAADAARQGGLADAAAADVARVLARLEAALRARTAVGLD
jgi:hypothetical protein